MKKIYVLLMHTNTIPSKLIRFVTRYKYSHVAISFQENCYETYSFGRKELNSILHSGFIKEYKDGRFFRKFNQTECKIYEISVTNQQYMDAFNIIKNMEKNKEIYKYDFLGIVFRFFNIPLTFQNKYVCSYFVANVLKEAKISEFNKDVCFIEPKDFENQSKFTEIYTGRYRLYSKI